MKTAPQSEMQVVPQQPGDRKGQKAGLVCSDFLICHNPHRPASQATQHVPHSREAPAAQVTHSFSLLLGGKLWS